MPKEIDSKNEDITKTKGVQKAIKGINNILGKLNLSLYGTDRTSDVDNLDQSFQQILKDELGNLTNNDKDDVTSFLMKLNSMDKKTLAMNEYDFTRIMNAGGNDLNSIQSFLDDQYKNKLLEYHDLHEVSSKLIELGEALGIMRDAVISADVIEGRMNMNINFENIDDEVVNDSIPVIEAMESKFHLREILKKFIVTNTLELGEYHAICTPYSKIFGDFMKGRDSRGRRGNGSFDESVNMLEYTEEVDKVNKKTIRNKKNRSIDNFINGLYTTCSEQSLIDINKSEFNETVKGLLSNVTVCNEFVPLPIINEGYDAVFEYMTEFVNESGDQEITEGKDDNNKSKNIFDRINDVTDGATISNKKSDGKNVDFSDIKDCYIECVSPMNMIPIKIMKKVIGYYYIQAEDIDVTSKSITSFSNSPNGIFDNEKVKNTVIDGIVNKIIASFDKKFLLENSKFKELIVNAIKYYDINEKKIRFQFIPAEYVVTFKIDTDEKGNGRSMLSKSLFYAKLYLMLLLFKYMSILLYSNDEKVNYVATSGISKNIANKVEEIIRSKHARQINIMDLFSLTSMINKVGAGNESYIPVGRNNERRPVETEVISGQDIQLDTPFMEELKKSYILSSGVPVGMINYLQEAEFAKQVEENHTKFNGRAVNYQLDLNDPITELYQMCARWSTTLDENVISSLRMSLKPPKSVAVNTKVEELNQATSLAEALTPLLYDDPSSSTDQLLPKYIRKFKQLFIKEQLPFIDFNLLEKLVHKSEIAIKEEMLKPNPNNGDNDDDTGFDSSDF